MNAIEVKHLTKKYGNTKAVNNISFTIPRGQIVGFVGKNGAGKSTTIRTLLNFIAPFDGYCKIFGLDCIEDAKKIREYVGYMPSDSLFYQGLTCLDIFKLCTDISGIGLDIAKELSSYFELDYTKKISELSLGNRKKVSIIQALLKDVKLLILDEPTSGLDPLMQEKFFELLLEKKKNGCTIFLSSHNLVEIERYCDRAIIIKDGLIIDDIDMNNNDIHNTKIVSYETSSGSTNSFEYSDDINELIANLSKIDLKNIEIRGKSVEDEFIKYYKEDK